MSLFDHLFVASPHPRPPVCLKLLFQMFPFFSISIYFFLARHGGFVYSCHSMLTEVGVLIYYLTRAVVWFFFPPSPFFFFSSQFPQNYSKLKPDFSTMERLSPFVERREIDPWIRGPWTWAASLRLLVDWTWTKWILFGTLTQECVYVCVCISHPNALTNIASQWMHLNATG